MPRVFVNYRRHDTAGHAGRLYDRLAAEFGEKNVFIDVDAIEVGTDFVERIRDSVEQCDAVLAVIGTGWLEEEDRGRRRIDDPDDFVRVELQAALRSDVTVIPVLVHGAEMPAIETLPEELRALARRQAIELDDARWNHDVGKLVLAVKQIASRRRKRERERERRRAAEASAAASQPAARAAVRRPVSRLHWAALGAVTVAAVVAGAAAGGGSEAKPPSNVTARDLGLTVDGEWQEVSFLAIPGLDLRESVSLAYDRASDALVTAGEVTDPEPGADPLPSDLARRFTSPPKRTTVSLGGNGAFAYEGVLTTAPGSRDQRRMRLFMVPTESGYEAVACVARPADFDTFGSACDAVAGSARIDGALPDAVGPSRDLGASLAEIVVALRSGREAGLDELSAAKTPSAQVAAARALAETHSTAADRVNGLEPSPRDAEATAELESALTGLGSGFSALAAATRKGAPGGYDAGREAVGEGDAALQAAIAGFEKLGYELE